MKHCPRCHSSMLLGQGDAQEAYVPLWRCLGCGQEMYYEAERQIVESNLLSAIRSSIDNQPRPGTRPQRD